VNVHKKIAGVPVWGWLIAASAAIALGLYLRRRTSAPAGSAAATAGDVPASGATADPSVSGMDPGLLDLIGSAQSALLDAAAGGTGTGDASGGFFNDPTSSVDSGGSSTFTDPAAVSVASSSGSGSSGGARTPSAPWTPPTFTWVGPAAPLFGGRTVGGASVGGTSIPFQQPTAPARTISGTLGIARPTAI
jgi:hypothetical protein